ncbi:MAG: hypothetical protein ACOC6N_01420 [archaeon]
MRHQHIIALISQPLYNGAIVVEDSIATCPTGYGFRKLDTSSLGILP